MTRYFVLSTLFMVGFAKSQTMNTMTDLRDDQVYKTITYKDLLSGKSMVWMAQNLNYRTENS